MYNDFGGGSGLPWEYGQWQVDLFSIYAACLSFHNCRYCAGFIPQKCSVTQMYGAPRAENKTLEIIVLEIIALFLLP